MESSFCLWDISPKTPHKNNQTCDDAEPYNDTDTRTTAAAATTATSTTSKIKSK